MIIYHADCIGEEGMIRIPDQSIDMILCDLPYGTTACTWDIVIPFDALWKQYKRVIKPNGAIVLTGSEPFSSYLRLSNLNWYKYDWVWVKSSAVGHLNSKKQPMRNTENTHVFYNAQPTYNPQKTKGHKLKVSLKTHKQNTAVKGEIYRTATNFSDYSSTERYPTTTLYFKSDKQKTALHPTQKPVALFEYLIRTYTNEGDTVLDNCMGSGTTAIACINSFRHYIGFEKERKYFDIANERIEKHKLQTRMF